jgi:hypothetical protein
LQTQLFFTTNVGKLIAGVTVGMQSTAGTQATTEKHTN